LKTSFGALKTFSGVPNLHLGVLASHLGVSSSHLGVSSRVFLACFRGFWILREEVKYLRSEFVGFLESGKMGEF